MRLAIFGATGGTGRELVRQALQQGHQLTCLVRNPATANLPVSVAQIPGDILDVDAVSRVIAGSDAVLSAVGARSLKQEDLLDRGILNILAGMKKNSVRRLIVLGAAGAVPASMADQSWVNRLALPIISHTVLKYPFQDQAAQEEHLRDSDSDYTIVRPPRLTNSPGSELYRVEADHLPARAKSTPRADIADFMLKQLDDKRYLHRGVYVAR